MVHLLWRVELSSSLCFRLQPRVDRDHKGVGLWKNIWLVYAKRVDALALGHWIETPQTTERGDVEVPEGLWKTECHRHGQCQWTLWAR